MRRAGSSRLESSVTTWWNYPTFTSGVTHHRAVADRTVPLGIVTTERRFRTEAHHAEAVPSSAEPHGCRDYLTRAKSTSQSRWCCEASALVPRNLRSSTRSPWISAAARCFHPCGERLLLAPLI